MKTTQTAATAIAVRRRMVMYGVSAGENFAIGKTSGRQSSRPKP